MFKAVLLFCLLAFSASARAADTYRTYTNARFGYRLEYPTFLAPQREADNGDGRRFVSSKGEVLVRAFGRHRERTIAQEMSRVAADWRADGARVTYQKQGTNWFVLSGFVDGDIFYEKTVARGDTFATIIWEYPRRLRTRLDAPLTRSVRSLGFTTQSSASQHSAPQSSAPKRRVPQPVAKPTFKPAPRLVPTKPSLKPKPKPKAPRPAPREPEPTGDGY